MSENCSGDDDDDEMIRMRAEYAELEREEQMLLRKEDLRKNLLNKKNEVAILRARQNVNVCDETSIANHSNVPGQDWMSNFTYTFIDDTNLNIPGFISGKAEKDYRNFDSPLKLTEKPFHSKGKDSLNEYRGNKKEIPDGFPSTNIHVNVQVQNIMQMLENLSCKAGGPKLLTESPRVKSRTEPYVQPYAPFTREWILTHLQDADPSSKRVKDFLRCLCSEAESKFSNVIRIWVGYEECDKNVPVFVAVVQQRENVESEFYSFKLIQRLADEVSPEATRISNIENEERFNVSDNDKKRLRNCIAKHSTGLMKKHSNLLVISASNIKSKDGGNNRSRKPCIVLYVHVKGIIPFSEDPFPKELDGIPVDVREAIFHTFSDPCAYQRRLTMGCQIVNDYGMGGSLGGFVPLPNGKVGCLTVWHMFQTTESRIDYYKDTLNHHHFKRDVYQPQLSPTEDFKFGQVVDVRFENGNETTVGVDAALIEITSLHRVPQDGSFASSDTTNRTPANFNSGIVIKSFDEILSHADCKVVKHGPVTKFTAGTVVNDGVAVRQWTPTDVPEEMCQLHQQIVIQPSDGEHFADIGDSGSLVFMVIGTGKNAELRGLGMVVGGINNTNSVIVTPLWAILESFGLPLQLHPFDNLSRFTNLEDDVRNMHTKIDLMTTAIHESRTMLNTSIHENRTMLNTSIMENRTMLNTAINTSINENRTMLNTAINESRTMLNTAIDNMNTLMAQVPGACSANTNGQQTHQQ